MSKNHSDVIKGLLQENDKKIVLVVADGLGGVPGEPGGKTELEAAETPHLDELARVSSCGLLEPVGPGITPGSGPAHLALFGYEPVENNIGRGVLSALGIDFKLTGRDVAARINFATVDGEGRVADRRAGRISTDENRRIVGTLRDKVKLGDGVECFVETVKEHRALLVMRGDELFGDIRDTDPQETGVRPHAARALDPRAERTASLVNDFMSQAGEILKDEPKANAVLLRGFAKYHPLSAMEERYGLRPLAIAQYPMYRGLARLVGMTVAPQTGSVEEDIGMLKEQYGRYDFFYLHYKQTDSRGEDGDFEGKVKAIEELDALLPELLALEPDVFALTADHSTPSKLAMHSWHPVPVVLNSAYCRADAAVCFDEKSCALGALGLRPSTHLMPILLAHAGKLTKFGA